ncbi:MAG TPA: ATP-binding protein [Steroidobacteraceae bacterium]
MELASDGNPGSLSQAFEGAAGVLGRKAAMKVNLAEALKPAMDELPLLAWAARSDGSIVWFNRCWYELTGASEARGESDWSEACRPDYTERALAGYRRALAEGRPWQDLLPIRGRDGLYHWFLTRAGPVRDERGRIECWIATGMEATEQIEAAEKLRESEARFRALVEASPLGMDIMDMHGEPIFYNPKCEALHGRKLEEARGAQWAQAVHPEDRRRIFESWQQAVATGRPWAETYRFLHADGRVVWVSGRAAPMHVEGRQVGWVGTLEDITDLKTAEVERERLLKLEQEARQRAERASMLRDETLAIVAHDLRNPLHTLTILATRLAKVQGERGDQGPSEAHLMLRTLSGMHRLIEDLLDISKIEAGGLVLEPERVDVRALLRETVESFEAQASEKGLTLTAVADESVGEATVDAGRLKQVLANVIGNAIKFTPAGGSVRLQVQRHDRELEFRIEDTGPGIPHEQLERIFDRYWQAHHAGRSGAGLGLAICRAVIEALGGRVWVESTPGSGTRITFVIPVESEGARND